MIEERKPITGYEGWYDITTHGRVWSEISQRFLKPHKDRWGYSRVELSQNGKRKRFAVHRLVAEHFLHREGHQAIVMHVDNDPSNNRVDNLLWGTVAENNAHCCREGRQARGVSHGRTRLTEADIYEIRALADKGIKHREIAEQFGLSYGYVGYIARRQKWAHLEEKK